MFQTARSKICVSETVVPEGEITRTDPPPFLPCYVSEERKRDKVVVLWSAYERTTKKGRKRRNLEVCRWVNRDESKGREVSRVNCSVESGRIGNGTTCRTRDVSHRRGGGALRIRLHYAA